MAFFQNCTCTYFKVRRGTNGLKQAQNMQWHYRRWMGHSQKLASQELSVSLSSRTFLQK